MMPAFREIRASDISNWADRMESVQWMPSLVRQLILTSGAKIVSCQFLTHEQINHPGWDGSVMAESEGLFVPAGHSKWELSREKKVVAKATKDIQVRSSQAGDDKPSDTHLLVVTLRIWPKRKLKGKTQTSEEYKNAWALEQQKIHGWKTVKVIDAADLATCLANSPAVSIWFSYILGADVDGAFSLLSHWDKLSTLRVGMIPSVFLAGRSTFVRDLDQWIGGDPQAFEVQTFSYEDLRDAIAAWWSIRLDNNTISNLHLHPTGVRTAEAWNSLIKGEVPMILLADEGLELTSEQISAATARGHYPILRTSAIHVQKTGSVLPKLGRDQLSEELKKCGIDYQDAWRIASDTAGNGVALKRMLVGQSAEPAWAKDGIASELAPIVLLGKWDSSVEGDCECIASLFGKTYEEVEALLEPWVRANDPLVHRNQKNWRVVVREDAWRWLIPHLKQDHLSKFKNIAVKILSEIDPRYNLPDAQRIYANLYGATPRYSHKIRHGVGEALCLLSLRSSSEESGSTTEALAKRIVEDAFSDSSNWKLWASLNHALMYIAEATPDIFLKILEKDLKSLKPAVLALFEKSGDGLFGDHPHVELMWALQALVWDREWVSRSLIALAHLAARDPGGNHNPRPFGVLRQTFLPWLPQCCLDVTDRCKLLDKILEVEPEVCWKLFIELLPKLHDVSSPIYRPAYRSADNVKKSEVSRDEYTTQVIHTARRLLENVGVDTQRWEQLIKNLNVLPSDMFGLVVEEIEKSSKALGETDCYSLWKNLRQEVAKHRYFATARWAMHSSRLDKLEKLVVSLEPKKITSKYSWLFESRHLQLSGLNRHVDFDEQGRLSDEARSDALQKIISEGGISHLHELVENTQEEYCGNIGFLVAKGKLIEDEEILPAWLESDNPRIVSCARGYAQMRFSVQGWDWMHSLKPAMWSANVFAEISGAFPFCETTWKYISGYGESHVDAYWYKVWPWTRESTTEEIEYAVTQFIGRGRSVMALDCVTTALRKESIATDVLLAIIESLRKTMIDEFKKTSLRINLGQMDIYHLEEIFNELHRRQSLTDEQVQKGEELEWFFLPVLKEHTEPAFLLSRIYREPRYFIELLSVIYRPDNSAKETESEPTDTHVHQVQNIRALLDCIGELPGMDSQGNFDKANFNSWVNEVRRLADEENLKTEAENRIGKILLYSPIDSQGFWPCATVCNFLSNNATEVTHRALEVAIFNNQGWPGPFGKDRFLDSVAGERQAMEKLQEFADKLDLEYPIVANLLRRVIEDRGRVSIWRDEDE